MDILRGQLTGPGDKEVAWDTWEQGKSPQRLFTIGVNICIGVTLYDPLEKVGYMAHAQASEASQEEVLNPMLTAVRGNGHDIENMVGWLAGGSRYDDYLFLRKRAISEVINLGILPNQINMSWAQDPLMGFNTALDCATGDYQLEQY